ncbi:MAG TPA: carboxypeptidase-like regulatory domain-containing protein [Planctomycetaceae bacterium]|nr:carboxypeptidase-like regulatory domain-containing protein [Planctomycetaceae bacterium]
MRISVLIVFSVVSSVLAGCGGGGEGSDRVKVYPVSGNVTMFGSPLGGATVSFAPQERQPTATGITDDQGNFKLMTYEFGDGAAAGKYKILISKAVVAASGSSGGGGEHAEDNVAHDASGGSSTTQNMVPPQYSSSTETPLMEEVKADGENHFKLEIK